MRRHVAVIAFGVIVILNQMVGGAPFPDDLRGRLAGFLQLDDRLEQHFAGQGLHSTGGENLFRAPPVPGHAEHVAVGQRTNIVVLSQLVAGELVVPHKVALPRVFLDAPSEPGRIEGQFLRDLAASKQISIGKEISNSRFMIALPNLDGSPLHVDQKRVFLTGGGKKCVALKGFRVVEDEPDLALGRLAILLIGALSEYQACSQCHRD